MEIDPFDIRKVPGDTFTRTPPGEATTVVCEGAKIPSDVAHLLPQYTKIIELPSPDGKRYYHVTVRGDFTIAQFVEIVRAFANGDFNGAFALIEALKPRRERLLLPCPGKSNMRALRGNDDPAGCDHFNRHPPTKGRGNHGMSLAAAIVRDLVSHCRHKFCLRLP